MGVEFIEQPIQVEQIENMKVLKGHDMISLMVDENRAG
jgi:L-alanine-DL-glutamate epimerase-like enolase superfamily enzyme